MNVSQLTNYQNIARLRNLVNSAPIRRQTRDNSFTPIEETMSALNDLVKAGKQRYVGISDAPA